MTSRIVRVLQSVALNRLDASLVRSSWLRRTVSEKDYFTTQYQALLRGAMSLEDQLLETKSLLASAEEDLAASLNEKTILYNRMINEERLVVALNIQMVTLHEELAASKLDNAGHMDLALAYRKLLHRHDELLGRIERDQVEMQLLRSRIEENQAHQSSAEVNALSETVATLTESVNKNLWNIMSAPNLRPVPVEMINSESLKLGRLLSPKRVLGFDKVRVGDESDGGYVMLDDFSRSNAAFSLGIGDNVSWDLSLANRGLTIFQFDHTIDSPPIAHPNFHFIAHRISAHPERDCETLYSILRHAHDMDLSEPILKIDIEHSEWDAIDVVDEAELARYQQIICEFHWLNSAVGEAWLQRAQRVLEKLNRTFQVIHVHGNNCAPYSLIAGIPFPSVLEVTYCNRSKYSFLDTDELFPGKLDAPNNPNAPDLWLGSFRF